MKRVNVRVSGLVQGVSFRQFIVEHARKFDVLGWVRNNYDGAVWMVAEGEEAAIDKLMEAVRTGPPEARVESIEVDLCEATGEFEQFRVRN